MFKNAENVAKGSHERLKINKSWELVKINITINVH